MASLTVRRALVFGAVAILVAATVIVAGLVNQQQRPNGLPRAAEELLAARQAEESEGDRDFQAGTEGDAHGGAGGESAEALTASQQWAEARTAPGIVAPGAYSAAFAALQGLPTVGGAWNELTNVPYDADDPDYRDYYSNSGGGSGLVTGRMTALAADADGYVYAGGADGGVWRSSTGGGNWTPIADGLPSLSSGDLKIAADGSLWYATGEANTGGTSYVGSGVYRLANPRTGAFSPSDRVGGAELESTTINALRFDGHGRVWAATLRGLYWHSDSSTSGAWALSFAPNPSFLPGGANASNANAAYKNIVNDVLVDPKDSNHLILGAAWRSGDTYNGFYESSDRGGTWTKVNIAGGLDKSDIGNISFGWASDGSKLYVINQSPKSLNKGGQQNTYLDGVYVSNSGTLAGPWTKIASSDKLAASGSALSKQFGVGYRPGIQAWYNQFILVDPANAEHVYIGLEEIFETKDGGQNWNAIGPYWNFYFPCWNVDALYPPDGAPNRCPQGTHPDQHSVALGAYNGTAYTYFGNDGGLYRRPLNGTTNKKGNATDWVSLSDGTIDALQYYAVGVGLVAGADGNRPDINAGGDVLVSGGLQDNGGSLLRPGAAKMVSNFGGDGGDVLVDPNDGCNIIQEYVFLSLELTQTCANPGNPQALVNKSLSTTYDVAPPDINARFIAPFVGDKQDVNNMLAGGNSIWFNDKGFDIRSGDEWQKVFTFGPAARVATAMAYNGEWAVAGWCGGCNNLGFARGVAVGHYVDGAWTWVDHTADLGTSNVPNRYIGGVEVADDGTLYLAMNGFNRRFTEGPGAGVGHVFKSTDHGATWTNISGNIPDVPLNSIKKLSSGALVVGSDLAVLYSADGGAHWSRLGANLPVTVAIDVEVGPLGNSLYAATHGRGIWRISLAGL
ncbi:MAG TPA: sialidase family protein [Patescibacteria group bacterium]|nr:sialidase family protein [Patescibacteria group bacterium]